MIGFPIEFSQRLEADGLSDLLVALNGVGPTSIRLNSLKNTDLNFKTTPISWCSEGRYLDARPKFTLDPVFHGGAYYVQEASSMIVGEIAKTYSPNIILDLCAAPGGKSTHLSSVVGNGANRGCVVANEVIRSRATILAENIQKWGVGNVIVTSTDPKNFSSLGGIFDMIVADVPCSGEGMFRKDVDARSEWSVETVALCAARGRRIISDVWDALKQDGILIYSTCTFNRDENQDNVRWICENLGATVETFKVPQGACESEFGVNFYPGKIDGEGFFVAVLRKTSDAGTFSGKISKPLQKVAKNDLPELNSWVGNELDFRIGGEYIYGYNTEIIHLIDLFMPLGVLYSGVGMGQMMRGELKPSHSLGLYFDVQAKQSSDLSRNEALQFLAKQTLDPHEYCDGLSLVRHNGVGLGWAKGLGRRVNNLYPQNWRILSLDQNM